MNQFLNNPFFFVFNPNRGRKPGAGNWKKVRGLQEKGKGAYYSGKPDLRF
jgi:hypothetical protein